MSPGRRSKEGQPSKAKHSKTPKQGRLFGHGNKDGFLFCVEGRAKTSTHISPSAPCKTLIRLRATRTTRTSPPPPSFPRFPHSPQPLSPLPSSLPSSQPQLLQALARSCCRRRRGSGGEAAADVRLYVRKIIRFSTFYDALRNRGYHQQQSAQASVPLLLQALARSCCWRRRGGEAAAASMRYLEAEVAMQQQSASSARAISSPRHQQATQASAVAMQQQRFPCNST